MSRSRRAVEAQAMLLGRAESEQLGRGAHPTQPGWGHRSVWPQTRDLTGCRPGPVSSPGSSLLAFFFEQEQMSQRLPACPRRVQQGWEETAPPALNPEAWRPPVLFGFGDVASGSRSCVESC